MGTRSARTNVNPAALLTALLALAALLGPLAQPPTARAELAVGQIQLYFLEGGRRTEATVATGTRDLKIYADLQVEGSGQLDGYWEVDGRRLENVSRRISFKQTLTLTTSPAPGPPAFGPGLHRVRFVVTSPVPAFSLPAVTYFVSGPTVGEPIAVSLKRPKDRAVLSGKTAFRWRGVNGADYFIVTFREPDEKAPVFAALVDGRKYVMRREALALMFRAGRSYDWTVTGVDEEGNILGRSETRRFTVQAD